MRLIDAPQDRRPRPSREAGFALPAVLGVLMIVGLLTAAVVSYAQHDVPLARADQDRKAALAAAEAGLNTYVYRLTSDPETWTRCTNLTGIPFVNQKWDGSGADPRTWRTVPGSLAKYTVELLPANGATACNPSNPGPTMVSSATGMIRIRATGMMRGKKRSVVTSFRRRTFLDYIYVTDKETLDPSWYQRKVNGAPTIPDVTAWATTNCGYYRDGRASKTYNGNWYDSSNNPHSWSTGCSEIQFAAGDTINGPLHTNDEIYVCGHPIFGRTPADAIEVTAPPQGWRSACSGSSPTFQGTWSTSSPTLTMPPTNATLLALTQSAYVYTGRTDIVLGASSMTVNGVTTPYPSNGLVYVKNGVCGSSYKPYDAYGDPAGCAVTYVKGTYGVPLTIASERDIVINGDVHDTNDAILGLIANEFVRIYHPVDNLDAANSDCDHATGTMTNVTVDAAILALNHSFMVDNYFCGGPLGTLTVNGTIAQRYRGPVGQGGSSGISQGYLKNYTYDDRLKYRTPPKFIDPVASAWRTVQTSEQLPPT